MKKIIRKVVESFINSRVFLFPLKKQKTDFLGFVRNAFAEYSNTKGNQILDSCIYGTSE